MSVLGIDHLETRTMLSATPIMGPPPVPAAATSETLNLQLQPGPAGSLAAVAPLIAADGGTVQSTTVPGLYTVQVPALEANQLAAQLAASPAVSSAAPVRLMQIQTVPNDPNYTKGLQWQLNGTWGINAPGAWSVTTGSNSVIVANVDSGLSYNLNDIYPNVWLNQAEIPPTVLPNLTDVDGDGVISFGDLNAVVNGVKVNQGPGKIEDSDGDGIITPADVLASTSVGGWGSGSTQDGSTLTPDDYIGWNFVSNTNTPTDPNSHGSFTSTEIAEVGNNGLLGTGVDWTAQLMPVAFIDSAGNGTDTNAAAAIQFAVDHGARVINASWGGSGTDQTIANAIDYADKHGVIVVAAAGNNATNDDTTAFVPASYSVDYPNLIAVASIDPNGHLSGFSNFGVKTVQLAAPGNDVYSMNSKGGFSTDSGTSMAAPLVTGTIALVEAAHPSWSMTQVIDAVLNTVTPDPALAGKVTTGGIVNAAAAVANTDGPYVTTASPSGSINGASGFSSVQVTFNEEINPATFTTGEVTFTGPDGTITGVTVTPVAGSNDHEFTIAFPVQTAAGPYKLTVGPDIQDWYGNAMNQNRDAVNGQSADAFVETIEQTAAGARDILSVTGIPATVTAGTSYSVTVTALAPAGGTDTSYLGTIDFTSTDIQAGLPSQYTFKASDAGVHIFNVTFKTAGFQSVIATDSSNSAITGSEENILVDPTTAASLKLTGFPTTDTAGVAETFTVTAYDKFGNVATGYVGALQVASSDAQATLPASATITPEDQGTATFTATLGTVGTQSITATDASNSSLTASETGITVQPGAASTFQVAGFPATDTAGAAETFTVTAYDAYNNIAIGYTGTVTFTSTDLQATFQPASYTFVTDDDGKHSFTATLKTAGTQSIIVTDAADASISGRETGIVVQPGALAGLAVAGFPTTATAGTAESFVVSAVDAYGNTVTGYTGTVDLSSSDTRAVIQPASYTFLASDNGTHTFTATFKTAGTQSITATDSTNNFTASETGIAVEAGATTLLQVAGLPSSKVAGMSFSLIVTALDAYGNVATGFSDTINLSSTDPQAVFQPSSHAFGSNDAGTYTFTVTLETSGSQTITFTDPTNTSLSFTTTAVTIGPAAVSEFTVSGFPATITAGTAGSVTVMAVDPYGNIVTGFTGTVALSSSDGQAALPASYTFTPSDDGKHTFVVTLRTAGAQSITASDAADNLGGSDTGITVQAAAASILQVSGFPTLDTAGVAHNLTVTAYDAFGNVATGYTGTVVLSSSDGQAGLPSSYQFTASDAGSHQFSVTLKTAGAQTITASDAADNLTREQTGIVVQAAAPAGFRVSGFPAMDTAGVVQGVIVTAVDPFGNTVSSYTGTVTLTSSDGKAALPPSYHFTASDAGTHQLRLALDTAGSQSITASDSANHLTGSLAGITVQAAAASILQVSGFPTSGTAGVAHDVTVTAYDAFGNVAVGYAGTVKFTSSDSQAGLPPSYSFAAGDAGVHQFSVTLRTAGVQSIAVTDAGDGISGSQTGITVQAAAPAGFRVSGFPATDTAGVAHDVTVTAVDAFGNTVDSYAGTVTLSSSDAQAVLPASHTFTAGDTGTFQFSVTLDTAGNQSITASDAGDNLSGTQADITVGTAAASALVFSQQPTNTAAGTAIGPAVTVLVEDPYHNLVTSDRSTVTLTLASGTLEGGSNTTRATVSSGVATFPDLKIDTAGRYNLTASDGSLAPAGPSDAFTISPAAPARLVITTEPSATATAGQALAIQPVIQELDAFGNLETADSTTVVTASPAGGTGTLGGSITATFSSGVATFRGLAVDSAGTVAIAFGAGSLPPATSSAITVTPAAAAQLVVTGPPPGSLFAGQAFAMTVVAEDAFGNPVPSYGGEVTISVPGDPGFTTSVAAHGGVASFTGLTLIANASGQAIQVTAAGLSVAATNPIRVTPVPNLTPTSTGTGSGDNTSTDSTPPTIQSERIVTMQKTNKKGKHVGKPRFVGFALQFSAAMDPTTAGLAANYELEQTFRKRVKHRLVFVHRAVALAASYDARTQTITLTIQGKPRFAAGGQLTILASAPGGVSDTSGALLAAADTQFLIGPKGKGITLG